MPIVFKHLNYIYSPSLPLETTALKDINLEIKDHSFMALVGHTGSGKSTLVQQINALLIPSSGEVNVNGFIVANKKDKKALLKKLKKESIGEYKKNKDYKTLRKNVGLVFQFPEYQLFEETVIKDVMFGPKNFGCSEEEAMKLAKEALSLVGIDESLYQRSPFELSGGQKRRVAIAGIITLKPDILILDEPTAGLDPTGSKEMMDLFLKLYDQGSTLIMVSHDMDNVIKYATDVTVLSKGEIIKECKPQELFLDDSLVSSLSIEEPKCIKFAKRLNQNGYHIDLGKVVDEKSLALEIVKERKNKMQNITIGKYVPYNSIIHRLDPRYKILAMIVLMVCIFFSFSSIWMNFIVYGILMIFIYIIMRISHIKLSMLFSQLKAIWIMMFVLFIVNIIVPGDASLGYFTFFNTGWKIYYSAIYNTVYILFRLIIMLSLSLVLTATTKPLELTNALEFLMKPLKVIKFPVHEIAMTISLALRFIPTLLEETDRIMKAQASRGVDFQNGKFKEKIKAIIALIIPLFISALARSEDLANAMEARGYNPSAKRTKYRINKWALRDSIASVIILLILGGLITLMVTNFDLVTFIQGLF